MGLTKVFTAQTGNGQSLIVKSLSDGPMEVAVTLQNVLDGTVELQASPTEAGSDWVNAQSNEGTTVGGITVLGVHTFRCAGKRFRLDLSSVTTTNLNAWIAIREGGVA